MYIPASFLVESPELLQQFLRRYSFATLVTGGAKPFITHLPLLFDAERGDKGTIIGHFTKPNPHWRLEHAIWQSVAIFQGPHAYISPSWYRSGLPAVPTWNYAVVHATGHLSLIEDPVEVALIIDKTVRAYDSGQPVPWTNQMPSTMTDKLMAGIVAFEMPVDRLEGKFKLGQNRRIEDQIGAVEALEASGDPESVALSAFARTHLGLPPIIY